MQKLLSIDVKADFGFFRKPDINSGINLSYNMIHKPVILGILGAIIGLEGYTEEGKVPEYYEKLHELKIGIEPLEHEKGNFRKTVIKYTNTIGYANKDGNYLTEEATLIRPSYRIYILLSINDDIQNKLYEYLKAGKAEYIPYFGKNECTSWWEPEKFQEYEFNENAPTENFEIKTIFLKEVKNKGTELDSTLKKQKQSTSASFDFNNLSAGLDAFFYFERLPMNFNLELMQYNLGEFAYSTFKLKKNTFIGNLYHLENENYYVQLL